MIVQALSDQNAQVEYGDDPTSAEEFAVVTLVSRRVHGCRSASEVYATTHKAASLYPCTLALLIR